MRVHVRMARVCCVYRGRAPYSTVSCHEAAKLSVHNRSSVLRLGVLGLGAIGTIFFTRLGLLAGDPKVSTKAPHLAVDAFVKTKQFENWRARSLLQLSREGHQEETLEFRVNSNEKVATVSGAPNVRVRTLDNALESNYDNRLDILFVAVKAYDSVGVIRELQKNRHLLKDDALCVFLQNGLGEVSDRSEAGGVRGSWQFVNGVTFVGGRLVEFGSVATSGLDAGMTYLSPFGRCSGDEVQASDDELASRRKCDAKMEVLAQVLLAAGDTHVSRRRLRCEVLETSKMQAMLWRKLIVNAAINPLASLLDAPNRSIVSSESSRECVAMVVREALAVAQCEQIPLTCSQEELVNDILDVAHNTSTNVCSMLADLRRGSRTEIDAITGRIVAGGRRHGIPTPTNDLLLSLIKALEVEGTRRR
ncbi:2-dehydropantoate 2-reductase [Phytophthora citrophthora]|uniref:2-dehydropantoate 2-reductase n=1 Tax=Phytophthora citrophthora TaxID=4793 RepID=A0AAD9LTL7_9STRA|nr:2-dehydropantoate 2-reductase [Phytophthora citrophthora]